MPEEISKIIDLNEDLIGNNDRLAEENNHILREKIGNNARNFILENCSLNSIVNREYKLYKELLNPKFS